MYETTTEAIDVLYALLSQGLGPGDTQVEVAFMRVRLGIDALEKDVKELRLKVGDWKAEAEQAAKERKSIIATLAKVLVTLLGNLKSSPTY